MILLDFLHSASVPIFHVRVSGFLRHAYIRFLLAYHQLRVVIQQIHLPDEALISNSASMCQLSILMCTIFKVAHESILEVLTLPNDNMLN